MEINIIVDNDKCWLLNTVKKVIKLLQKKKIVINSIWILPEKLSNLRGRKIKIWYLNIFGNKVFLKLSLFYLFVLIINFFKGVSSFKNLAKFYNIKYFYIDSLNDKSLYNELKSKKKKI